MGEHLQHLERSLQRIEATGGEARTLLLARRDDAARDDADALDSFQKAGPLAGLVLAAKACFDVEGWVTHCGSAALVDEPVACVDSSMVASLRDAGAVLVAQTNMTEFAYGALGLNPTFGSPSSPFFPLGERVSGGSTSGGAVAVAKGLVDIALGSDTSGSVRIPAAFCGVAGFKPSKGRYAEGGMSYLSPTFDTPGIIAESGEACRSVDRALVGGVAPAKLPLAGVVAAVPREIVAFDIDADVLAAFEATLDHLRAAGVQIVDRPLRSMTDSVDATRFGSIIGVEAFMLHRDRLLKSYDRYDPRVGSRIVLGEQVPAHIYATGLVWLREARAWFDRETRDVDVVLSPTVPMLPPRIDDLTDDTAYLATNMRSFRLTEFANRLDLPSISLPGDLRNRRPLGLLVTGRRGKDVRLLDIAVAIERHLTR